MIVYRIGRSKWCHDLKGEGARINGGRWNHVGTAYIYTSVNRALALLEYSAHIPLDLIPRALSFTSYEIPADMIFICDQASLPGNWKNLSYTKQIQDFGDSVLKDHLVFQVPSVVLEYEFNYVLNPKFPDFNSLIRITKIEDYSYDVRIKF